MCTLHSDKQQTCVVWCRSKLQHSCERLLNGVNKLNETEALVTSMKADLARLQPVLEAKAAATAELLVKVCPSESVCQCITQGSCTVHSASACGSYPGF
jgi:hypothetical protein